MLSLLGLQLPAVVVVAPTGTALELTEALLVTLQPLSEQENHPHDSVLWKPLGHGFDEPDAPIFVCVSSRSVGGVRGERIG